MGWLGWARRRWRWSSPTGLNRAALGPEQQPRAMIGPPGPTRQVVLRPTPAQSASQQDRVGLHCGDGGDRVDGHRGPLPAAQQASAADGLDDLGGVREELPSQVWVGVEADHADTAGSRPGRDRGRVLGRRARSVSRAAHAAGAAAWAGCASRGAGSGRRVRAGSGRGCGWSGRRRR